MQLFKQQLPAGGSFAVNSMINMEQVRAASPVFRVLALAPFAAIALAMWMLSVYPPTELAIYPKCAFYHATGFACAGCGGTRALYALTKGHVIEALHQNAMIVLIGLPFLLLILIKLAKFAFTGDWKPLTWEPSRVLIVMLSIVIAFWIVRNIPAYPFNLLFPTQI